MKKSLQILVCTGLVLASSNVKANERSNTSVRLIETKDTINIERNDVFSGIVKLDDQQGYANANLFNNTEYWRYAECNPTPEYSEMKGQHMVVATEIELFSKNINRYMYKITMLHDYNCDNVIDAFEVTSPNTSEKKSQLNVGEYIYFNKLFKENKKIIEDIVNIEKVIKSWLKARKDKNFKKTVKYY